MFCVAKRHKVNLFPPQIFQNSSCQKNLPKHLYPPFPNGILKHWLPVFSKVTIKIDSEMQGFFCRKCSTLINTCGMVSPLAHMQREWLERKFDVHESPQPWQRRGCSLTFTFSPFSISISLSSPMVNSFFSTLEPVVTVILNFFPSCTISEMLLMSLPFWIWSSGSPAQEQEPLSEQWSHLWADCCC